MLINKMHSSKGSSLIEVLIALFVLAIGILGVLAMQVNAVKLNQNAYLYSQANILAMEIVEAVRSTPTVGGSYAIGFDDDPVEPNCTAPGADCTPEELADWNVAQWRSSVAEILPEGAGEIEQAAGVPNAFKVSVRFRIDVDEDTGDSITDTVTLASGY